METLFGVILISLVFGAIFAIFWTAIVGGIVLIWTGYEKFTESEAYPVYRDYRKKLFLWILVRLHRLYLKFILTPELELQHAYNKYLYDDILLFRVLAWSRYYKLKNKIKEIIYDWSQYLCSKGQQYWNSVRNSRFFRRS